MTGNPAAGSDAVDGPRTSALHPSVSDGTGELPMRTLFEILADDQRRHILTFLHSAGKPVTLAEIIDHVVVREQGVSSDDLLEEERTRVALALHHTHLPKLMDAGMVTYDHTEETIAPAASAATAEPHLALVAGRAAR